VIIRTFRGLIQLIGGLTVGLVLLLVFGFWRLSSGPIPLDFMTPYLENALKSEDGEFAIKLKTTRLAWDSEDRALQIRLLGATAIGESGEVLAEVPELVATLAGQALLKGQLAPRSITVMGPSLTSIRRADGSLTFDLPKDTRPQSTFMSVLLERLISPDKVTGPLAYLDRIRIEDGLLTIEDLMTGTVWSSSNADIELIRSDGMIFGRADLDIRFEDQDTAFSLTGEYAIATGKLSLDVGFADLNPRAFSTIFPAINLAESLDAPVTGTVSAEIMADGTVPSAEFSLSSEDGNLRLADPIAMTTPFKSAVLRGYFDQQRATMTVEELAIQFDEGTKVNVPAPIAHAFPVRSISLAGRYFRNFERLDLSHLTFDLGGPSATFVGSMQDIGGGIGFEINGLASDMPVDRASEYWPASIAADPRTFILRNIKGGMVPSASVRVIGTWDRNDNVDLTALTGEIEVRGTSVDYVTGMPKAMNVDGTATFNKSQFNIQVTRGEAGGVILREGRVLFTDLEKVDQFADIELLVGGSMRAGLAVVNHPPLEFAKELEIEPETVQGEFDAALKLNFIAEKDLTMDGVKIEARATLRDLSVPGVAFRSEVTDGDFELTANQDRLEMRGTAKIDTVTTEIDWRMDFDETNPIESRFNLVSELNDTQRARLMGLEGAPFSPEFMTGPAKVNATVERFRDGRGRVSADFALDEMALAIPHFGWAKKPGVAATAHIAADLTNHAVTGIPAFSVSGAGLTVRGSAVFDGTTPSKIMLDKFAFGGTDVAGVIIPQAQGWDMDLRGPKLDFNPWLEEESVEQEDARPARPITLSLNVDRVQLDKGQYVKNVSGALFYDGLLWKKIDLRANLDGGQPIHLDMRPENGRRLVKMTSEDAGAALRALGYYQNMVGGKLDLQGTYEDGLPGRPLKGTVRVSNFRVVKAPLMARVLSLAALTGFLEALTGEGLSFTTLEAPYTYRSGVISLTDAKASGLSLGFTATGTIDTNVSTIDLAGTIVPAYAINSLLGRLPVVGQVFTGGEKGGGVFAANYTLRGPLADPVPAYNPLSALAPGFLRNLFGVFDGADGGKEPAKSPAPAPSGPPPIQAPPASPPVQSAPLQSN